MSRSNYVLSQHAKNTWNVDHGSQQSLAPLQHSSGLGQCDGETRGSWGRRIRQVPGFTLPRPSRAGVGAQVEIPRDTINPLPWAICTRMMARALLLEIADTLCGGYDAAKNSQPHTPPHTITPSQEPLYSVIQSSRFPHPPGDPCCARLYIVNSSRPYPVGGQGHKFLSCCCLRCYP